MYTTQYNTSDEDNWTSRSVDINSEDYIDIMSEPVDLQQRRCLMLDLANRFLNGLEAEVCFLLCSKARRNKDLSMAFNLPEPEIARLKSSVVRKASLYVKYFYNIPVGDVYADKLYTDYSDEWTAILDTLDDFSLFDIPEVKKLTIRSILSFDTLEQTVAKLKDVIATQGNSLLNESLNEDALIYTQACREAGWADGEPLPKDFPGQDVYLSNQIKKLASFIRKAAEDGDATYQPLRDFMREVRFCTSDCPTHSTLDDVI